MQLFHAKASPFVRKVMIVLHETGLAGQVELIEAAGSPIEGQSPARSHNPLGKIPTLTRADGPALYDSRVICRYLDDLGKGGLYPQSRIWETLTLEATGDGIMEAAILMVYEGRLRPEDKQFPDWVEAQWTKIDRALDALEGQWMSHLHGPLDAGQIAIAAALGYLDFRHDTRDWRTGRPALAAWLSKIEARPSLQSSRPDS